MTQNSLHAKWIIKTIHEMMVLIKLTKRRWFLKDMSNYHDCLNNKGSHIVYKKIIVVLYGSV